MLASVMGGAGLLPAPRPGRHRDEQSAAGEGGTICELAQGTVQRSRKQHRDKRTCPVAVVSQAEGASSLRGQPALTRPLEVTCKLLLCPQLVHMRLIIE